MNNKWNKVGVFIVIGTLVFVVGLLAFFFKEDKLTFDNKKIVIEGSYGEALTAAEIESVQLVYDFPNIRLKTNGFALGTICKGFFKTDKGEIVKLILNADNKPYILFTKTNGEKIYFSAQETPNQDILDDIKRSLPQIEHKP